MNIFLENTHTESEWMHSKDGAVVVVVVVVLTTPG